MNHLFITFGYYDIRFFKDNHIRKFSNKKIT